MIELQTEGKTGSGRVTGGRALWRFGVKLVNAGVNVLAAPAWRAPH